MSLLAFALALLPQDAPRETASGFTFALPKGWTRREDPATQATVLTAPNLPAGQEAQLILYPTGQNGALTLQAFHDSMFKSLTSAFKLDGDPQTGTTGRFQWSRAKVTPAGGSPMRVAIYSASSGDTLGAAVFVASDTAFASHLAAVEQLVKDLRFAGAVADPAPAAPAKTQTLHGLVLPLPEGWTRKDDPNGLIALFPPPPKGPLEPSWDYVIYVLPSQPLRGTPWETHKALFDDALKASQLKNPVPPTHSHDEPGPFIRSASAGHAANGAVRAISIYSAPSDGHLECLLIHNQEDRDGLRAILSRATVKNPPKKADRPKILEAYRRGEQKLYTTREGGALASGSLMYERIWLRADGVADFTTCYAEGYAASPAALKLDPGLLNGSAGAWKKQGDARIEILRTAGRPAELYERDQGNLRSGAQVWQRMPPVDGLRLDGRWGLKPDLSLELTKVGRFKDDGVFHHAAFVDTKRPKPPKKGAGTYELREWTIFLSYDDGTAWSTDFSTIGPDPQNAPGILLGVYGFPKE